MSNIPVDDFSSNKAPSVTWALCWKQWHELSSPLIVLTAGSMVLLAIYGFLSFDDQGYYSLMGVVPIMMSICFIFVCCFTSFVTEKESRTISFLRDLPASSVHVGSVKVLMIGVVSIIFAVGQLVMAGFGAWMKLRVDPSTQVRLENALEELVEAGATIGCFMFFAAVISLLSCSLPKRAWQAVVTVAVMGWAVAVAFSYLDEHYFHSPDSGMTARSLWEANSHNTGEPMLTWLGARSVAVFLCLLVVGAVWAPLSWLRRRPSRLAAGASTFVDQLRSSFAQPAVKFSQSQKRSSALLGMSRGGRFGALLWQSVGQQRVVLMFCSFFMLIVAVGGLGVMLNPNTRFSEGVLPALLPAFGMTGLWAGWLTLNYDKKNNNFAFFQQHREHGVALMIARIIPPIVVLLVLTAIATIYLAKMNWLLNYSMVRSGDWVPFAQELILSWLTGYCAVVPCSMIFRSQVYSLGVALVVALVGGGTIVGTYGWPGAEGTGSFATIFSWMIALPFIWLISSIAYGPTWLSDRRSWSWMAYFAIILLLAFALPIYALACWFIGIKP
jgi:hypothetical protein